MPVFYRGRQVGERRVYNDSLLLAAIRATDPGSRGVGAGPAGEWDF